MQRDSGSTENTAELDGTVETLRTAFLDSMASNSTSVQVVTTRSGDQRFGVTVSACSSVCADPPTLLVCINTRSPANAAVAANGVFAVNLLYEFARHAGRAAHRRCGCRDRMPRGCAANHWHAHGVFRRSGGYHTGAGAAHAPALLQTRLRPVPGVLDDSEHAGAAGMNDIPNGPRHSK